jgi:AAA+ ATPase superfamily predicted ATPase
MLIFGFDNMQTSIECDTTQGERDEIQIDRFEDVGSLFRKFSLILGFRGVGKTTLVLDIIRKIKSERNIDNVVCFSMKEEYEHKYDGVATEIHNALTDEAFGEIIDKQREDDGDMIVVIDDSLLGPTSIPKNLQWLIFNGHHIKITLIITYPLPDLPLVVRDSVDALFIYKINNKSNTENCWKRHASNFATFSQFDSAINTITNDIYTAMVIYYPDKVSYYKADL